MKIVFSDNAWEDYLWWQSPGHEKELERINTLIKAATRTPFKGLGKPEPLKGDLRGWWSRRITDEHRFVYSVSGKGDEQSLQIAQLRYHY
ncbi:Txe/YoeB family addiction module toxin [Rhodovulum sulfidophilum]|uniref:Putative mRNA interferase YoeB n=1 Tax=Rhodovulum sulfidophilum TaxID=35806 RepID=A0ABS1RY52_RHOSU|nr:Txe/YoeB family addiction module toxin [Rhodovulum sulfidophilum]MBL3610417.1 Txe/YoeB family addiction module toxin [Rhodovulum sulfidophilum]MCE8456950.1 Txe/YoeB family addiction module toxin [Rhodovulum sulfidophilum]